MSHIKYCGYCGKAINTSKGYCQHCGKAMKANSEKPQVYYKTLPIKERRCVQCGSLLADRVQFCGECGTKNEAIKPKKLPYCVLCDELLPESAEYCTLCGVRYTEHKDGYVAIPIQSACGACGTLITQETSFCTKCGASLKNRLAERIKKTIPVCRFCGTPIHADRNFCQNCGKLISNHRTIPQKNATGAAKGAYVHPILEGDTIKCPLCGLGGMRKERTVCWRCSAKFINPNNP